MHFYLVRQLLLGVVTNRDCVSSLTTFAELMALSEALKESHDWLCKLLNFPGVPQHLPIFIYCDNQATIHLVKNPEYHNRTKLVDIKYFFMREHCEK